MLIPAKKWSMLATLGLLLTLLSCTKLKDVEVVNPCSDQITVKLWETPRPAGAANDTPTRVVVGRSTVVGKDALADAGNDGSSAEIVAGPGTGQVLTIPHGGKLVVSIPAALC